MNDTAEPKARKARTKMGASRSGTGTVSDPAQSGNSTFSTSSSERLALSKNAAKLNVKNIPVTSVETDKYNPRQLDVSKREIEELAKIHPIDKLRLEEISSEDDYLKEYIEEAKKLTKYENKKLNDLTSIIKFAFRLRRADRLINTISVIQHDSSFIVYAGERRLLSHTLLNETYISASIKDPSEFKRDEIDQFQWDENLDREDMIFKDKLLRVKKLIEINEGFGNISVTKLTKRIGRSRTEAQRYLSVLRYENPILMKAICDLKVDSLDKAASFAKLTPEDIDQKLNGTTKPPTKKTPSNKSLIKFDKKIDKEDVKRFIGVVAKKLGMESLINNYDLEDKTELSLALATLIAGQDK
ncbi:MAG: hypothetical protein RPR97_03470 [Colwellia sp.]|jgi:hypothetical protein